MAARDKRIGDCGWCCLSPECPAAYHKTEAKEDFCIDSEEITLMRKATDNPHDFIVSDEQRTLPDGTPCRLFIVEDTTDNTFHPFANYGGKVSTSPMPCGSLAGAREWLQTFFLQMQE